MKLVKKIILMLFALSLSMLMLPLTYANSKIIWCVYDIGGAKGEVMQVMRDYTIAAKDWGVDIQTRLYRNDEQALNDYRQKKCDAVVASNFASKPLNNFMATIGAVGLIPNHQVARQLFLSLGEQKLARHMISGSHEVVGWMPIGAAYFMVKDKRVNTIAHLAGKRLGVVKYDITQEIMARRIGAKAVKITLADAGARFASQEIDVLAAPIYAYQPLELKKILGSAGGVVNYPVSYLSLNFIIDHKKFPRDFGVKSRAWFKSHTPRMMNNVAKWEKTMPIKYWYDIPLSDRKSYQRLLSQLRKEFIKNGEYDQTLSNIVLKIHCVQIPEYFECKF